MATVAESASVPALGADGWRTRVSPPVLLAAGALLLAVAALPIDLPLSRVCCNRHIPGDLGRAINLGELFGHGLGVAVMLLTAATLDPRSKWAIPRIAAGAYGGGALANLGKLLVARARPSTIVGDISVLDTFHAWLPVQAGQATRTWNYHEQGFPSAHAATAFGLAVGLSLLYPRGRWLFFLFAVGACTQRIFASAHFLSDVLAGAAVGCLAAAAVGRGTYLGRRFDRWEARDQTAQTFSA